MDKKSIKGNYIHKTLINTSPAAVRFMKRNIFDFHSNTLSYLLMEYFFFFFKFPVPKNKQASKKLTFQASHGCLIKNYLIPHNLTSSHSRHNINICNIMCVRY